jgi:hypothetical protein
MTDRERLDAPNQQVVREDGSGPADEGTGGAAASPAPPDPLDDMTKDELLAEATARGVDVDASATKADIKDAIRGA